MFVASPGYVPEKVRPCLWGVFLPKRLVGTVGAEPGGMRPQDSALPSALLLRAFRLGCGLLSIVGGCCVGTYGTSCHV